MTGAGQARRRHHAGLAAILLSLSACSDSSETSSHTYINRPDGLILVWGKTWSRDRFRMPMDHGADTTELSKVFQAFSYPADGTPVKPVPIAYRADLEHDDMDMPALVWRKGGLHAGACYAPDQVLAWPGHPCQEGYRHLVGQVAHRAEDARIEGTSLLLAIGPAGERDCRVDIQALPGGFPSAEILNGFSGDYTPFQIAHFPGVATYLIDRSNAAQPLYRLHCGKAPELLGNLALHKDPSGWTEVLDLVPGGDAARPLALLATTNLLEEAVLRDPQGILKTIPIDLLDREKVSFLATDGRQVIVKLDYPFSTSRPNLELTLFDTITGKTSRRSVTHDFAPWPARPSPMAQR